MNWLSLFAPMLLLLVGSACLGLAGSAWRYRATPGAGALAGLHGAVALWSFAYGAQLLLPGLTLKMICTQIVYLGVVVTPVAWLLFAARYTQQDGWLNRRSLVLLALVPSLTVLLAWTNWLHGLLWRQVGLIDGAIFSTLAMRYGPWFFVHTAYSYALLLAGTILLLRTLPGADRLHRLQAASLVLAVLAPWAGNVLHLLGRSPIYPLDLTPFLFAFSTTLFSLGVLRLRILDVLPVAYSTMISTMSDAVVVVDSFGRTAALNAAAERIFGLTSRAALGLPAQIALAAVPAAAAQAVARDPVNFELAHTVGGRLCHFEGSVTPLLREGGRLAGRLLLLRDVTLYRQAVERQRFLAEASALLASSLDYEVTLGSITRLAVPALADICLVHVVEPDGSFRRVAVAATNPALEEIAGTLVDLYPPPPDAMYSYPYAIRTGKPWLTSGYAALIERVRNSEPRQKTMLDAIKPCSTLSVPLSVGERVLGALTFVTAESGRQYGPDDLELATDLGRRAALAVDHARLVAELRASEARAQAANAAAAAATEAKSTFLAHASHEIRNPLAGVVGLTEMLVKSDLSPWQLQAALMLRSSSNSLMAVVNDILDLTKIESGKLELDNDPVDLLLCSEEALDLVAVQAEAQGLDLSYVIMPGTPPVFLGDHKRLRQVLVNLLGNAIKFTPRGSVALVVTTPLAAGRGNTEPSELRFTIRDTGVGIAPEDQVGLFQSFSQLATPLRPRLVGTGLGLAISKQLCELMGGSIGVMSEVGRGSVFHFSIKVLPLLAQAPTVPLGAQQLCMGRRLLVVGPPLPGRDALVAQAHAWGMLTRIVTAAELQDDAMFKPSDYDLVIAYGSPVGNDTATKTDPPGLSWLSGKLPRVVLLPLKLGAGSQRTQDATHYLLPLPLKFSQLYPVLAELFRTVDTLPIKLPAPQADQLDVTLRVFIAEDDEANLVVLQHLLSQVGLTADVAPAGDMALDLLLRHEYDLAILDLQLPGLNGIEVAVRLIEARPPWARPYLAAYTASATVAQRELCLKLGLDDYLSKPLLAEGLTALLMRVLSGLEARRAAAEAPAVDLSRLEATYRDGARPVLDQLIGTYLKNGSGLVANLRAALELGDVAAMEAALHRLRSSSTIVAADRLVQLSADLEQLIRDDVRHRWTDAVWWIEGEYTRVAEALAELTLG